MIQIKKGLSNKRVGFIIVSILLVVVMLVSSIALFTDRYDKQSTSTTGKLDLVFTDVTDMHLWSNGTEAARNEDKAFDFKLTNAGSTSIDVTHTLTLVSPIAFDGQNYYDLKLLDENGNEITLSSPVYSADNKSVTYTLPTVTINGVGDNGQQEAGGIEGVTGITYTPILTMSEYASSVFANTKVDIIYDAQANYHRNPNSVWMDSLQANSFIQGNDSRYVVRVFHEDTLIAGPYLADANGQIKDTTLNHPIYFLEKELQNQKTKEGSGYTPEYIFNNGSESSAEWTYNTTTDTWYSSHDYSLMEFVLTPTQDTTVSFDIYANGDNMNGAVYQLATAADYNDDSTIDVKWYDAIDIESYGTEITPNAINSITGWNHITLNLTANTQYYLEFGYITSPDDYNIGLDAAFIKNLKFGNYIESDYYQFYADTDLWVPDVYTINYVLDGGTIENAPTAYTAQTPTFSIPQPTKPGYEFMGWTGSNGETKQTNIMVNQGTTGDLTYYAHWERLLYWGIVNDELIISDDPVVPTIEGEAGSFYRTQRFTATTEEIHAFTPWAQYRNHIIGAQVVDSTTNPNSVDPVSTAWWFAALPYMTSVDVSQLDTSNVDDMQGMFAQTSTIISGVGYVEPQLETIILGDNFDTSNVTNMYRMFYGCDLVTSIDVSGFDTAKVTNMSEMFYGCDTLEILDVSGFNTENLEDASDMFNHCIKLVTIDVSNWETTNLINARGMFDGCFSLKNIDVTRWNTTKLENINGMFYLCKSLQEIDLSTWDGRNITNMGLAFNNGGMLYKIKTPKNIQTAASKYSITDKDFIDVDSLVEYPAGTFPTENGEMSRTLIATSTIYWGITDGELTISNTPVNGTVASGAFEKDDEFNLAKYLPWYNYLEMITSAKVTGTVKPNSTNTWFAGMPNIIEVDLSGLDGSNLIRMKNMFNGSSNLTSIDMSNMDVSNVTTMDGMFNGCTALTEIKTPKNIASTVTLTDITDKTFYDINDGTEYTAGTFPVGNGDESYILTSIEPSFNITYNLNGGTLPDGATTSYQKSTGLSELPTPTKEGFTFIGWYTTIDFSDSIVTAIAVGSTGEKVYYAKWEEDTSTFSIGDTRSSQVILDETNAYWLNIIDQMMIGETEFTIDTAIEEMPIEIIGAVSDLEMQVTFTYGEIVFMLDQDSINDYEYEEGKMIAISEVIEKAAKIEETNNEENENADISIQENLVIESSKENTQENVIIEDVVINDEETDLNIDTSLEDTESISDETAQLGSNNEISNDVDSSKEVDDINSNVENISDEANGISSEEIAGDNTSSEDIELDNDETTNNMDTTTITLEEPIISEENDEAVENIAKFND